MRKIAKTQLVLTIRQPWVELILLGRKRVEYRSWNTPVRGTILLHAAYNLSVADCREYGLDAKQLERSAILGSVELFAVRKVGQMYHWHLRNPQRLGPIPAKGQLKFWTY